MARGLVALGMLWALLAAGAARAGEITWAFPLAERHTAFVEIRTEDEALIGRFKVGDQIPWKNFGWRPDLDDERGQVAGRVEGVFLPPGVYLVDLVLPDKTLRQVFTPDEPQATVAVRLPEGGTAALAIARDPELGNDGIAWARVEGQEAQLPLGGGEWDIYAADVPTLPTRYPLKREGDIVVAPAPPGGKIIPVEEETTLLRVVLIPMTLLLFAAFAYGLRGLWRTRGALVAAALSTALSVALCHQVVRDLFHAIPCRFPRNYKDPFDTVFFAASFADSVFHLSDVTQAFAYPDGASWLGTGPAWLAYLLPGVLTHLVGPVAAGNLAIIALLSALGVSVWALAREVGAGPWTAVLAGGAALISPLVLSEIDKASLDRLFLFPIPLFFLCLHRAVERPGFKWAALAGVALAGVFYGQVYYGIYLAAACPLLILPRLWGPKPERRLLNLVVVGAVGGMLIAPGLYVLRTVTEGGAYDSGSFGLLRSDAPLWPPVEKAEAEAYFSRYDMRLVTDPSLMDVSQQPTIPMDTPTDRFLAAANSGMFLEDFLRPINHLPGEQRYWIFIGISLVLAVRRKAALVAALDIGLLVAYSLGPLLRSQAEALMIPLPYYLNLLFIPGFDQLKNLYRYRLMAATLCAVPMALAAEGVFERLGRIRLGRLKLPRLAIVELGVAALLVSKLVAGSFQWPTPYVYTRSAVIEGLDPAPAILLPIEATLDDPAAVMSVVNAGLPVVNEMPLEPLRRTAGSAKWFEQLGLLNKLADLSGARRPNRLVPMTYPDVDRAWLDRHGVRYAILYRQLAPGVELVGETTAFLDAAFERVGQDGSVTVWDLQRPLAGSWAAVEAATLPSAGAR